MKLHCIINIARQVGGKYVFLKMEKAIKDKIEAFNYVQAVKKQYTEANGTLTEVNIATPQGQVPCHCEIALFEAEIECDENNKNFFALFNVAKQVDGEFIFVRLEKCCVTKEECANYYAMLLDSLKDAQGVVSAVNLVTPHGNVSCLCEFGIYEINL